MAHCFAPKRRSHYESVNRGDPDRRATGIHLAAEEGGDGLLGEVPHAAEEEGEVRVRHQ